MIQRNLIEMIRDKADIIDIISDYIPLTKKGADYLGLCPFHDDHHPSLHVSQVKGTYKCFACGASGDAISFLENHLGISFPEAAKLIADKYGIDIQQQEISDEDVTLYKKQEAMYIINKSACEYFVENLFCDTDESHTALEYAKRRWPEDFIRANEIGFALNGWTYFLKWAESKGLDKELLLEIGLIVKKESTDSLYDFYRGRIMIPIRNRQKHIIGFTARILPEIAENNSKAPKYLNSASSLIFNKSSSLFGIDKAYNTTNGIMNIVEGAPDVMKLQIIGVNNVIAPLGTSLTSQQLGIIKGITADLNIIPDSDISTNDTSLGAGFLSAIHTGKLALANGFTVTVQEIPTDANKSDPDSYFTSKEMVDALPKQDFVEWYADKIYKPNSTDIPAKTKAIHDIVDVIKTIKDKVLQQTIIDNLKKKFGHHDMWQYEVYGTTALPPLSEIVSAETYSTLFKGSEILVSGNSYLTYAKDGKKPLSNFIMIPLYLIRDGAIVTRVFVLRNVNGQEVRVEFTVEELTQLPKFRNRIEREINFMWYGSSSKFNQLRGILYSNIEVITRISTLGWQRQGFFAFGNGIVYKGTWYPVDEEGIVRLNEDKGSFYLPAFSKINEDFADKFIFEKNFVHIEESTIRLYEFATQLILTYGKKAIVGICFIAVCLFRDIIIAHRREFPSLFLFGPKGTGKTAFGELLQSVFVHNGDHPNLRTSTMASLATVLSQAENSIVHLDEYKNDIDIEKIELLKGLWDCQGRSKLDIETHRRDQSKILCGVIISGQEKPTIDIALYSRQCVLPFQKSTYTIEEKNNFRILKSWEHEGTSYIVLELLKARDHFASVYMQCYDNAVKAISEAFIYTLDERILHNWSVIFAAYLSLIDEIKLPFSYEDAFNAIKIGAESQNEECLHSNELSSFWTCMDFLRKNNQIFGLCDFRIHEYTSISVDVRTSGHIHRITRDFGKAKRILLIPVNGRIFTLYGQQVIRGQNKPVPVNTLKYYLENSPEYIGKINSMRFAPMEEAKHWPMLYANGLVDKKPRLSESPSQALCFDYDAVSSTYGVGFYADCMNFDLIHMS